MVRAAGDREDPQHSCGVPDSAQDAGPRGDRGTRRGPDGSVRRRAREGAGVARTALRARRQADRAGMRLIAVALAALAGGGGGLACANLGDRPGGPPDTTPPVVVEVRPGSGAVVPDLRGAAVIRFDDVIDEMAGSPAAGGGPAGLGRYVLLSPVAGAVKVGWHRSSISIEPKEGWKPGRVYHLHLLPGIVDLRRNVRKQGLTIIFSTGPTIPTASLAGTAVLWVEQRALAQGLIRAVPLADTVGYLALTDSVGRFRLDAIPPGRYI